MGNHIKKTVLLLGLLVVSWSNPFAQENPKQHPLSDVIANLQKRYDVQFNYAEDILSGIILTPPPNNFSLQEALTYLTEETGLIFNWINNRVIVVKSKSTLLVCGFLIDKNTQNAISNVTIQGKSTSTISDEAGFFQLAITSLSEQLIIRHLAYKSVYKTGNQFNGAQCNTIYMLPNPQALSEVTVSNYIVKGINKINNGSFEINFSEFDMLPGLIDTDVLQSVQAFPGIQSINETVSNINIRGGTNDQNLILWDGIKMYQSGHFFGLISMYNPQITQRVVLRKNGTDVTYTDGVSGTISMQTDSIVNQKFNGSLGVNLIDANGFADIPLGSKSSIQIAARKSISDFIETPTYNEYFDRISQDTELENSISSVNSDKTFDFYDASLRWIYDISDKDRLQINFITVSNELQFNESATVNAVQESRESSLSQNSMAGALHYYRRWTNKLQTTFEAYETDYNLKAVNSNVLEGQRFLQKNKVSETSVKLKATYKLNDKWQLLSGYHFAETEVTNLDDVDDPVFRLLVSEVVRTHGVFSQLGFVSSNKNTHVNAGVRFNYIDKFNKTIWEPRLSFSQRFLTNFVFEVLGEFKHQNTSQVINFQNDFLGIEKRRWQLSDNKNIPILSSKQLSTGCHFSSHGWLASIEGYYKYVKGVTAQSQGFQNQYEFVKTSGNYKVLGIDVLLRKQLNKFNTWLSYSLMDNKYYFKNLEPNDFPSNYNIRHAMTLGVAYTSTKLKLASGLNWHSGKPTTRPIAGHEIVNGEINFDKTNHTKLNDYMRLDISATYMCKFNNKFKGYFGVSIWNVLNKDNQINSYYRVANQAVKQTVQQSLGITPNAVLRVYF